MVTKKSAHSVHTKKELKKELAQKIETALPEIEESLGKKKFNKRLKKVTRLLVKGVHLNGADKKSKVEKKMQKKEAVVKKKAVNEKISSQQKDSDTAALKQHV
jgi:hypothetical protein